MASYCLFHFVLTFSFLDSYTLKFTYFVSVGTASNLNAVSKGETRVLEDSETVSATRDASCLVGADPTAKSQNQDSSKGQSGSGSALCFSANSVYLFMDKSLSG